MRKIFKHLVIPGILLINIAGMTQEEQSSYINYQAVARDAEGKLMTEQELTINMKLRFGAQLLALLMRKIKMSQRISLAFLICVLIAAVQ